MAIHASEDRNIVNFARKIVGEKLITERRLWETMRDSKNQNDVRELGDELLTSYRSLMIGVTSLDLINTNTAGITHKVINMDDSQNILIDKLSTYLLLELTEDQLGSLLSQLSHSIFYWQSNKDTVSWAGDDDSIVGKTVAEIESNITDTLAYNIPYVVLILLADLHHLTYVASAEQCLEILSST